MKIRIGQYAFGVGSPYYGGYQLGPQEADALNGLRAENIRNNVKRWVDKAQEGLPAGELLGPEALAALQDRVAEYAQGYVFGEKREPKGGIRKTTFEQELRAVARERVETQARQQEVHLGEEELEAAIEAQMKLAQVVEEARRRVSKRIEIAKAALQELI